MFYFFVVVRFVESLILTIFNASAAGKIPSRRMVPTLTALVVLQERVIHSICPAATSTSEGQQYAQMMQEAWARAWNQMASQKNVMLMALCFDEHLDSGQDAELASEFEVLPLVNELSVRTPSRWELLVSSLASKHVYALIPGYLARLEKANVPFSVIFNKCVQLRVVFGNYCMSFEFN